MNSDQIHIEIEHPQIQAGIRASVAGSVANRSVITGTVRRLVDELNAWAGDPPSRKTKTKTGKAMVYVNDWGVAVPYDIYQRVQGYGERRTGRTTRMLLRVLASDPKQHGAVTVVAHSRKQATRLADRLMQLDTDGVLFRYESNIIFRGDQRILFTTPNDMYARGTSDLVFEDHTVREVR